MKIVLTDAHTMNPGDISWDSFFSIGDVDVFEHSTKKETMQRVQDADVIVTNKTIIDTEVIDSCKNLKLICVSATGFNNVDVEFAKSRNIPVCNAANYSSLSVAQHVIAMILNVYNQVDYYNETVHRGDWQKSRDFTYFKEPIEEIADKNFGIIGYGSLGKEVANLARAFGANILVLQHSDKQLDLKDNVLVLEKNDFLKQCDIISIHVPLRDSTEGLVDNDFLIRMKSSAILVNTSRGPVVIEDELANALVNNEIRAACVDVLNIEPPKSSPLFGLRNCYITPHQAWASKQARIRLMKIVIDNISNFKSGIITNQVN